MESRVLKEHSIIMTGITAVEECTACDPGHYCNTPGLEEPTGLCLSSYFCIGGAIWPDPN